MFIASLKAQNMLKVINELFQFADGYNVKINESNNSAIAIQ